MIKNVLTVVGARPQFIKAASVSRAFKNLAAGKIEEKIIHTGQHFDHNMSQVFFDELNIPMPAFNLQISGGSHGQMTGKMLDGIEQILLDENPDCVLIYGDTNSTLAGALAAAKLHIPVAHVEAGLRSYNMKMPEEINRTIADRISSICFCTSELAVKNLKSEGITTNVINVGDVMYDTTLYYGGQQAEDINEIDSLPSRYALVTCHRAENTDNSARMENIMRALSEISHKMPVIFPLHPRTKKVISDLGLAQYLENIKVINPLSYKGMLWLQKNATVVLTDSGGVQKEAYFLKVPCVTMRDETEWVETVKLGANQIVGADSEKIIKAALNVEDNADFDQHVYGDGKASEKIVNYLQGFLNERV